MSETEPTRALIAKVRELDDIDPRRMSWWRCDECNGIVSCDEDCCCTACGSDARLIVSYHPSTVHELASAAVPLANEVDRLTTQVAEQAQEIERLRRMGESAQTFRESAEAKLRAVEALRDELLKMEAADIASADESPFAVGRQLVWPGGLIGRAHGYKNAAAKLTAILTPEAQS